MEDNSCSDGSSSRASFQDETQIAPKPELAERESKAVKRTKGLVYIVLLLFATGLTIWSHLHLKRQEADRFQVAYESHANALLDGAERNARQIFANLDSLSEAVSSHADVWPQATLPYFNKRATPSVNATGDQLYLFAPIVTIDSKRDWEEYTWEKKDWLKDDLELRGIQINGSADVEEIPRRIHAYFPNDDYDLNEITLYAPIWQVSPPPQDTSILLLDLYSYPTFRRMIDDAREVRHALLSEVVGPSFLAGSIGSSSDQETDVPPPTSFGLQPVYEGPEPSAKMVGFLFSMIRWDSYFLNILPPNVDPMIADVKDSCGSGFSYVVKGPSVEYYHSSGASDAVLEEIGISKEFVEFLRFDGVDSSPYRTHCSYHLTIRPTPAFKRRFQTTRPIVYPILLLAVFVFTAFVFGVYDLFVRRRNTTVMDSANKTSALVSSLFPETFQDRILKEQEHNATMLRLGLDPSTKHNAKDILMESHPQANLKGLPPIAELYPSASIIFADMCGFTSWSSTRHPVQVFHLLETIYGAFDEIAKLRRVYKVETIGDCWMGACGLPEVRKNHAVTICRFASDIVSKMYVLVRELEVELGPDTTDLGIRVGIHSGPVTGGILRGERARFQLFGDTVNTASRMESTGMKNRVQISEATKQHLVEAGKAHWVEIRDQKVYAKGKGEMQTYWLNVNQAFSQTSRSSNLSSEHLEECEEQVPEKQVDTEHVPVLPKKRKLSKKDDRLVKWNSEQLLKILKMMKAKRQLIGIRPDPERDMIFEEQAITNRPSSVAEELADSIAFSEWKRCKNTTTSTDFDPQVGEELTDFVTNIALLYRNNAFHSFAHASHVTMSTTKLFRRILQSSDVNEGDDEALHDHTYGLTSDPLILFSVVFAALIHDVDHPGVPNSVLVLEKDPLARKYHDKSPAEQRSIDCAWGLLQHDRYHALRRAIYCTKEELHRFRKLVVCCVMSTDICDKQLASARKKRWNKAFANSSDETETTMTRNCKATVVLEHLIQASDVSHTMQHWHVYRKWNECFFVESMKAYQDGRTSISPIDNWYSGELGFFDHYIIPLAKKLADCGVFGVSSDEYLNYAMANRYEWEARGREIVSEMVEQLGQGSIHVPASTAVSAPRVDAKKNAMLFL